MAQQCRTCAHASRREIERLREGGTTLEDLSAAFGLTVSTINRHLNNPRCRARWAAVECAPEAAQAVAAVAGRVAAPDRPTPTAAPPTRRRAIAGAGRVHPVSRPDNDPGSPVAAPVMSTEPRHAAPIVPALKSSLPTNASEVALLASLGYTDQQLGELVGCGASTVADLIEGKRGSDRALFDTTSQDWARHFVRLAMEELIGLRRRRQAALDGMRWREAERFDPKIAAANRDLFLTLQRFGLVGPVPPEELSKRGRDAQDIWDALRGLVVDGRMPPELSPEEEFRWREEERRAIA